MALATALRYGSSMAKLQIPSPLGPMQIHAMDAGLRAVRFLDGPAEPDEPDDLCREAAAQLRAWFAGARRDFDLPLAPEGTDFQRAVWAELLRIPFGETRSYGQIAALLGQPGAARAVGLANGKNPIAILVPCHRVIGANQRLVGYAGGLDRKRWLLAHEAPRPDRQAVLFGAPPR